MSRVSTVTVSAGVVLASVLAAACNVGPAATSSFDRTYTTSGPIRLVVSSASGAIRVTGTTGNTVRVHGDVKAHGMIFNDAEKQAREVSANPPIEQKPDTIRVGTELRRFNGVSIDYTIEVPRNCEVQTNVASGSQQISDVQGPVKIDSASGSIRVSKIDRSVQVNSASGSITAQDLGDDFRANSASGSVTATSVKGDVRARTASGSLMISGPGARVDAGSLSGSITVTGAGNDVSANVSSGHLSVQGNPSGNSYWNLKTTSGGVDVGVPASANFHLSARATSGEIRTGVPIVIEDQDKHSLRARVGNPGGRVEIHTVSGGIRVDPAS
jgi:DUF4097 and DUF4098 domain-containing protein YvlB